MNTYLVTTILLLIADIILLWYEKHQEKTIKLLNWQVEIQKEYNRLRDCVIEEDTVLIDDLRNRICELEIKKIDI